MSASQFCPACPTDMPEYRETGRWVEVADHEHQLPVELPCVYLYCDEPVTWAAYLPILEDGGWRGWREFPTQAEAMNYAARELTLAPAVLGVPAKEKQ